MSAKITPAPINAFAAAPEHQPAVVKDFVLGQLPEDLETEISDVARAIFDTSARMKADRETLAHLQGVETWLLEEKSRRDAGQGTAVMAYLAAQSASQ